MKTTAERITRKRYFVPELYRALFNRCIGGKASPREAIKMQCLECWGYVRNETATCDNAACPLWRYRPYQDTAPRPRQDELSGSGLKNNAGGY
jgi:hypothetical protein